jgi:archaellum component FlaD/FlaE
MGAGMGAGKESPGASERSNPCSSSERGMSSEKGAASDQRSEKGADKGLSKDKSNDRAQYSIKGAAKDSDTSKSDRAAKENKDSSSGAASGESGKPSSTSAEGRSDTSGKAHVSLSQEQRTRVQSAFKSHRGSAKVDVKIEPRIGVLVPRNVTLFDIPEDVVIIVPEWRRYKYVLIGDEICIVDLDTYEIVEVVAAV